MELLKQGLNIDFLGKRNIAIAFSIALLLISLFALISRGLNFGIDFTGGTVVEVGYTEAADLEQIRSVLAEQGYDAKVQYFGSSREVLIRLAPIEGIDQAVLGDTIIESLQAASDGDAVKRRIEFVGPQIGDELRDQGGMAMLWALLGILIYVALRFEFRFSLGAIIALVHDVMITLGFFAVTQYQFDLTVLAAFLAVIGYSLNDTIVVFDRIRENFRSMRRVTTEEAINISVNQTLSRTLMTSITTLIVLITLFLFGGETIHSFAVALIVGVLIGTYSSIFVASTATLLMGVTPEDLIPDEDDEELDNIP